MSVWAFRSSRKLGETAPSCGRQSFSSTIVAPSPPSLSGAASTVATSGCSRKNAAKRLAQPAGAVAVHHAQAPRVGQQRVVQKLLRALERVVDRRADEHQLRGRRGSASASARAHAPAAVERSLAGRPPAARRRLASGTRMRLPRISTSTCLPETPRTMPSAANDVTKTVCPTVGGFRRVAASAVGRARRRPTASAIAPSAARLRARSAPISPVVSTAAARGTRAARRDPPAHRPCCFSWLTTRSTSARASRSLLVQPVVEPLLQHGLAFGETRFALEQLAAAPARPPRAPRRPLPVALDAPPSRRSMRARCAASCDSRPDRRPRASAIDGRRHAEPLGDLEREATARRAVDQSIRRRIGLGVEPESRRRARRRWSPRTTSACRRASSRRRARRDAGSDR